MSGQRGEYKRDIRFYSDEESRLVVLGDCRTEP